MSDTGFVDFALAVLIVLGMLAGLIVLTRPTPPPRVSPRTMRHLNERDEQGHHR